MSINTQYITSPPNLRKKDQIVSPKLVTKSPTAVFPHQRFKSHYQASFNSILQSPQPILQKTSNEGFKQAVQIQPHQADPQQMGRFIAQLQQENESQKQIIFKLQQKMDILLTENTKLNEIIGKLEEQIINLTDQAQKLLQSRQCQNNAEDLISPENQDFKKLFQIKVEEIDFIHREYRNIVEKLQSEVALLSQYKPISSSEGQKVTFLTQKLEEVLQENEKLNRIVVTYMMERQNSNEATISQRLPVLPKEPQKVELGDYHSEKDSPLELEKIPSEARKIEI